MKTVKVYVLAAAILFLVTSRACEPAFADLTVLDVVNQVSQVSYTDYLDNKLYTHSGDNRGFGAEHDPARDNIYVEFDGFGLNTSLDAFGYGGSTYYNVVGAHYGTVSPDEIYILGAHYDSFNNPGADDNASGAAGVIEAARVLSQYEFEKTLLFIAFDREEQGLRGSKAYVQEHKDDDILSMVSLDMISYNSSDSGKARIYGRSYSAELKQSLADATSLYGNGLSAVVYGELNASDHAPFEDAGFQACLLIEYDIWNNPYYHSPYDSVDMPGYIDYAYATNMVRSAVGLLATEAVLIPEPATILLLGLGGLALLRKQRR